MQKMVIQLNYPKDFMKFIHDKWDMACAKRNGHPVPFPNTASLPERGCTGLKDMYRLIKVI